MTALYIGAGPRGPVSVPLNRLNRHVLIAGATGTGKTSTIAGLIHRLSAAGVPVLAFDAKGDLQGHGWRLFDPMGAGDTARPLDLALIGPDLLARALDLSEAQSGVLYVVYAMTEAEGLALHSLTDLRTALQAAADDAGRVTRAYGLFSLASAAAVSRAILRLQRSGAAAFGISTAGRRFCPLEAATAGGPVVVAGSRLIDSPGLYGAAVAYALESIYTLAPEVGDPSAPLLVVVIDEAHLLFDGAPVALVRRIEQIVRLIRSKGVSLVFATQSPCDLPAGIAGQLQTRIQHGLRSVTAAGAAAVRAAAESMPAAPGADLAGTIGRLGIGQALVSVAGVDGAATLAEVVRIDRGA